MKAARLVQVSKAEWKVLTQGARAFSPSELSINEARRKFEVTLEGIESDDRIRLRVHHGSDRTLPRLTYGVRAPDLVGALWLDVSKLGPGESTTLIVDAYREQADPRDIKLELEEPTPETRASFRELQDK